MSNEAIEQEGVSETIDESSADSGVSDSEESVAAVAESEAAEETDDETGEETDGETDPELRHLEEEGEVAADYIEELLDICDLDGDIDIDVRGGRAYVAVSSSAPGSNLNRLAGQENVAALQELTRLAVQRALGSYSRLVLDVQGSREQRALELAAIVDDAASRLHSGDSTVSLPGMSSYERKLVHDLAAKAGLSSESEGQGNQRHVVISDPEA